MEVHEREDVLQHLVDLDLVHEQDDEGAAQRSVVNGAVGKDIRDELHGVLGGVRESAAQHLSGIGHMIVFGQILGHTHTLEEDGAQVICDVFGTGASSGSPVLNVRASERACSTLCSAARCTSCATMFDVASSTICRMNASLSPSSGTSCFRTGTRFGFRLLSGVAACVGTALLALGGVHEPVRRGFDAQVLLAQRDVLLIESTVSPERVRGGGGGGSCAS